MAAINSQKQREAAERAKATRAAEQDKERRADRYRDKASKRKASETPSEPAKKKKKSGRRTKPSTEEEKASQTTPPEPGRFVFLKKRKKDASTQTPQATVVFLEPI